MVLRACTVTGPSAGSTVSTASSDRPQLRPVGVLTVDQLVGVGGRNSGNFTAAGAPCPSPSAGARRRSVPEDPVSLSLGQLGKPYSRAMASWAVDSVVFSETLPDPPHCRYRPRLIW